MNLTIALSVRLKSGAEINLTKDQYSRLQAFVYDLVVQGDTPKSQRGGASKEKLRGSKRGYKRLLGARRWTREDDERLLTMKRDLKGQSRRQSFKVIAQALGRTPASISSRYALLLNGGIQGVEKGLLDIVAEQESLKQEEINT